MARGIVSAGPPIDLGVLTECLGCDVQLVRRCVADFLGSLGGRLERLEAALGSRNAEQATQVTTGLKNDFAVFGAQRAWHLAVALEAALHAGVDSRAQRLGRLLLRQAAVVQAALRQSLRKKAA